MDSLAFAQLGKAAERLWNEGSHERSQVLANRAVKLYKRPFLGTDDFVPEYERMRDTLDAQFQRLKTSIA